MSELSVMQQILGSAYEQLPPALQAHHQYKAHQDVGTLDIAYPMWMQLPLNGLRLFGVLLNRRASAVATTVNEEYQAGVLHWDRQLNFADGKVMFFKSTWQYAGDNTFIEYVQPWLGLCSSVSVKEGRLYYAGKHLLLRIGSWAIPVPEWLAFGHSTIEEFAIDATHFGMDFRLTHPWFGETFRYTGIFSTKSLRDAWAVKQLGAKH